MEDKKTVIDLCISALKAKELYNNKEYQDRLQLEAKEINAQNEFTYFLELYKSGAKYTNENNLLIPYLLGICSEFNIKEEPKYEYGDFPDVDIDYLPEIREYLKEQFAKEQFGEEYVCNICSYNTFGLRSALIDMARVYGKDRNEVMSVTKQLKPKDDQGETLTWENALRLYDDLRDYCEENKEIAEAARRLVHRNRSLGQHASGLIISGVPVRDFVPLVRGKGGSPASAWVEGLHGTDLGAVGLVKFDFLSLDGNMKIAMACKIAMDICRQVTDKIEDKYKYCISALPGKGSWTDTRYLNDPEALKMANNGDLKMIFQFDGSEGIRRMARDCGIDSFDNLVSCTALFRPGCISLGYHEKYINRKRGKEEYSVHPLLEDALGSTYGVLVYQEQIMQLLNMVGKIPLKDCEIVRKAISKKQLGKFEIYKKMFIENGQKLLSWEEKEVEHLFDQIAAFASYGFNKCVHGNTEILNANTGEIKTIKEIYDKQSLLPIHTLNENKITVGIPSHIHSNGIKPVYRLQTRLGNEIIATGNHPFKTLHGWKNLSDLKTGEFIASPKRTKIKSKKSWQKSRIIALAWLLSEGNTCHPSSLYVYNNNMAILEDFIAAAKEFNNTKTRIYKRSEGKYEVCANTGTFGSRKRCDLRLWAERFNLCYKKADEKLIPSEAMQLCDSNISLLLGRLWSGDGFVCSDECNQPYYATSSVKLAKQVKSLLLRLGIVSSMHKKKFKYKYKNRSELKTGYTLNLVGRSSLKNFIKLVGPHCITKEHEITKLKNHMNTKLGRWNKENSHDRIPVEVFDIIRHEMKILNIKPKQVADKAKIAIRLLSKDKKKSFQRETISILATAINSDKLKEIAHSDIFWDQVVSITYEGENEVFDFSVPRTHNFVANNLIVHNSHAVAYTYISSRMLYLKVHHPKEFYASVFTCMKVAGPEDYQKIKDYKHEATKHGVAIERLNINKSKANFSILDNKIYYGFDKIKGIGDQTAKRLEELQPYKDLEDLLVRFGTDSKVINSAIGLGCFPEDRMLLSKYYEAFKDFTKKNFNRLKRFDVNLKKLNAQIAQATSEKELVALHDKLKKCIANKNKKDEFAERPTMKNFNPDKVKVDPAIEKMMTDKSYEIAEEAYYGFIWTHPLEQCEGYSGYTFENYMTQGYAEGPVEVMIKKVETVSSPKTKYYKVSVEDSMSNSRRITVWGDDYERFSELLVKGNLLRVKLNPPKEPFPNFTLAKFANRWKRPSKEFDTRIVQMFRKFQSPM